jgi:hypothetical protein
MNYVIPGTICGRREIVSSIYRCVVNEDINPAPFFDELSGKFFHTQAIGYGDFGLKRPSAKALDLAHHFLGEIVPTVITERHVSALTGKHFANCSTNSARSSTYERSLSFKQKAHSLCFSYTR